MIVLREETEQDAPAIHELETKAFGRPAEANIVDALRKRGRIVLSLVAVDRTSVVGHVLFSPVSIEEDHGLISAVGLGPLAVSPESQRKGIGTRLVRAGLEKCREHGHDLVVVLGSPSYYQRFGFLRADRFGFRLEGAPPENFMLIELRRGALSGKGGPVKYQPEFNGV
jgi:putative acetyltransferase